MRWKITDDRPIWIQLKEQIIKMILSGQYQSGEKASERAGYGKGRRCKSEYDAESACIVGSGRD